MPGSDYIPVCNIIIDYKISPPVIPIIIPTMLFYSYSLNFSAHNGQRSFSSAFKCSSVDVRKV